MAGPRQMREAFSTVCPATCLRACYISLRTCYISRRACYETDTSAYALAVSAYEISISAYALVVSAYALALPAYSTICCMALSVFVLPEIQHKKPHFQYNLYQEC
eukprot:1700385-Rhodomonas_salina.1